MRKTVASSARLEHAVQTARSGVVLGFDQYQSVKGVWEARHSRRATELGAGPVSNVLESSEAGVLYSLGLPLLVFAEDGVAGGVFDPGVTDVFIHQMPSPDMNPASRKARQAVFQKWQTSVRANYCQ